MMKKLIIFIPFLAFIFIGCSDRETTPVQPIEQEEIIPTYDMAQYVVPDINVSNLYQQKEFEKSDIDARYRESNVTNYFDETYEVFSDIVKINIDNEYEFDYIISGVDDIILHDILTDERYITTRVVSVRDVVASDIEEGVVNGLDSISDYECTILQYLEDYIVDNNTLYSDVIHKRCTKIYTAEGDIYDINTYIEGTSNESYYYAKGIGLVSSTIEDCKSVTMGTNPPSDSCLKTETNIVYIKPN